MKLPKLLRIISVFLAGFLLVAVSPAYAFAKEELPLDELVTTTGLKTIAVASVLLVILVFLAFRIKHLSGSMKKLLFFSIAGVTLLSTFYLIASTIYLNVNSSTKGPVHWHADFEIWACGQEIDLRNPKGWSNKIGTPTLHEHNDKRIHVEGVVVEPTDVSLSSFFRVIGGELTASTLATPVEHTVRAFNTGDACPDGTRGEVQVFVYKTHGDTYSQQKIMSPEAYILAPYPQVPSGDCIIIEFGEPKERTEKLCKSYQVAERIGKIKRQ